jgi:hypothetical protein
MTVDRPNRDDKRKGHGQGAFTVRSVKRLSKYLSRKSDSVTVELNIGIIPKVGICFDCVTALSQRSRRARGVRRPHRGQAYDQTSSGRSAITAVTRFSIQGLQSTVILSLCNPLCRLIGTTAPQSTHGISRVTRGFICGMDDGRICISLLPGGRYPHVGGACRKTTANAPAYTIWSIYFLSLTCCVYRRTEHAT